MIFHPLLYVRFSNPTQSKCQSHEIFCSSQLLFLAQPSPGDGGGHSAGIPGEGNFGGKRKHRGEGEMDGSGASHHSVAWRRGAEMRDWVITTHGMLNASSRHEAP